MMTNISARPTNTPIIAVSTVPGPALFLAVRGNKERGKKRGLTERGKKKRITIFPIHPISSFLAVRGKREGKKR